MSAVSKYLAAIGRRGGRAGTGKSKARSKAQARAAAKARWNKARALRQNAELSDSTQPPTMPAFTEDVNGCGLFAPSHGSATFRMGARNTRTNDEWLTPPEMIRALGEFDLDPATPAQRPWPTAKRHLTAKDNGLVQPWEGRVWLNPPYGNLTFKFIARLAEHGNGIALIAARTETRGFFAHVWPRANALLFLKGRVRFYHLTAKLGRKDCGSPSVLIAYGSRNVEALKACGLEGALVCLPND